MANPNSYKPKFGANITNEVDMDGYTSINNVGAVTSTFSPGATVALTSTGLYTVTFSDSYARIVPKAPVICVPGGGTLALYAQIGTWTRNSMTIRIVNGSGALTTPSVHCAIAWGANCVRA